MVVEVRYAPLSVGVVGIALTVLLLAPAFQLAVARSAWEISSPRSHAS